MLEAKEDSSFTHHAPCPECSSSDAYSVYTDGHAFCFSCQKYFPKAGSNDGAEKRSKETANFLYGDAQALKKRGLTLDTVRKFGYRVAKVGDSHVQISNYFDKNNTLVAQHLRYPDKTFAWVGDSKQALLFGQHLWTTGGRRLVITEGEIDCLTISQIFGNKWQTVSLPNGAQSAEKAIKKSLEFVESFGEVVLAFDDDDAGRKAVAAVAPLLTPGKVKVMSYEGLKDANEMMTKGKADRIANAVFSAKAYRPDGIISGCEIWEAIKEPPAKGLDLIYPILNRKLMGLHAGELVMLTAGSGIGKSTLAHEIGYDLLTRHEQSIGVMALEENIRRAGERYLSISMNRPLHLNRDYVTDAMLREAFDKTVGTGRFWLYNHFGSTQLDNLLSKVRYMVVGCGVKFIILDHISIVVSGLDALEENERRMIDKLMTKLRSLVEETGCGLIAVVHLKRPDKGKSYNEGRQVSLTDLRGSAAIEQLSDTVLAMERDQQSEESNISQLRILKNRRVGITGLADTLVYDPVTGRLKELKAPGAAMFADETRSDF